MFGNNDRGVDQSATSMVGAVSTKVAKSRDQNEPRTRSAPLPILSNVAYGTAHFVQSTNGRQLDVIHLEVHGA